MSTELDALMLANALEVSDKHPELINVNNRAAAKLRRLHAEVEELRGALDEAMWHVKYKELKAVNESDTALLRQALEALEQYTDVVTSVNDPNSWITVADGGKPAREAITALRERLAQPNDFNPDWDAMAVMVEEQQRMATEIDNLKRRLKSVNTAAMRLTSDLTCMEVDDDDRLDRDRVMERVMQWRNEWDKAMHNNQSQMQPCAGRNCGSTNPNLHSAECFEDYEKSTGMNQWQGLTDEEINNSYMFWIVDQQDVIGFGRSIETKLKRKNT